jgi:hypothetical protein
VQAASSTYQPYADGMLTLMSRKHASKAETIRHAESVADLAMQSQALNQEVFRATESTLGAVEVPDPGQCIGDVALVADRA